MIRIFHSITIICITLCLPGCKVHYRDAMRTSLDQPQGQNTAELPASFEDGWIFVDATVNGRGPYRFMVDTGAPFGLINTATAELIGLRSSSKTTATDIVGVTATYPVAFSKVVQVGPLTVQKLPFIISDGLREFFATHNSVGILGIDAFDDYTIDLDYPNSAMRLSTEPLARESLGMTEIRIPETGTRSPDVPIELLREDGTTDLFWFTVDTGADSSLHLLPEATPHWTHADIGLKIAASMGISGTTKIYATAPIAGRLRLSGSEIHSATAQVDADHAIIGHELLRLFRVRLDSRSRVASITPADQTAAYVVSPQYGGIGLGEHFRLGDFYAVLSLNPESPAYRAGLRPGDAILAVGGVPVPDLPLEFRFTTTNPPREQTITVGRNGKLVFDLTIPTEPLFPEDPDRLRNRPPDLHAPTIPMTTNPDGTFNLTIPDESDGLAPFPTTSPDPANH